jgi:hypothetical protein
MIATRGLGYGFGALPTFGMASGIPAPSIVVAQVGGGVNYNQARRAWILREDEELVILNGRLSQP